MLKVVSFVSGFSFFYALSKMQMLKHRFYSVVSSKTAQQTLAQVASDFHVILAMHVLFLLVNCGEVMFACLASSLKTKQKKPLKQCVGKLKA